MIHATYVTYMPFDKEAALGLLQSRSEVPCCIIAATGMWMANLRTVKKLLKNTEAAAWLPTMFLHSLAYVFFRWVIKNQISSIKVSCLWQHSW